MNERGEAHPDIEAMLHRLQRAGWATLVLRKLDGTITVMPTRLGSRRFAQLRRINNELCESGVDLSPAEWLALLGFVRAARPTGSE